MGPLEEVARELVTLYREIVLLSPGTRIAEDEVTMAGAAAGRALVALERVRRGEPGEGALETAAADADAVRKILARLRAKAGGTAAP